MKLSELIDAYLRYSLTFYPAKSRRPGNLQSAFRSIPPEMIDTPVACVRSANFRGWHLAQANRFTRQTANERLQMLKALFVWGLENEHLPTEVAAAINMIRPLPLGRGNSRENQKVPPVAASDVQAVMPHVARHVAAMLKVHWHTGMRASELVSMTPAEVSIDADHERGEFRPRDHKTAHKGRVRCIYLGPVAIAALLPWLNLAQAIGALKVWPIATTTGYQRHIQLVCRKHNLKLIHVRQIRHSAATRFAHQTSLETARDLLGHASVKTTEIYAEPNRAAAIEAAHQLG